MKSANSYRLGSRQAFYTRFFAHTLYTHPARAPQVLSLLTRATREPPRHQNSGTARPLPRECARREEGTCRAQKERRCRFACAARCVRPQGMHQHGASLVCERATLRARFFGWRSRTGARAPFLVASRLAHGARRKLRRVELQRRRRAASEQRWRVRTQERSSAGDRGGSRFCSFARAAPAAPRVVAVGSPPSRLIRRSDRARNMTYSRDPRENHRCGFPREAQSGSKSSSVVLCTTREGLIRSGSHRIKPYRICVGRVYRYLSFIH